MLSFPTSCQEAMSDNPYAPPQINPAPASPTAPLGRKEISGIGGWLAFLCVSLILGLVFRSMSIWQNLRVMFGPEWSELTSPGTASYDPMWGPGIVTEVFMLLALLVLNVGVLYLLFRKKRSFSLFFLILVLSNIMVSLIDFLLCSSIEKFPEASKGALITAMIQSVIYATVWGLYVLKSVRVRNTFVH